MLKASLLRGLAAQVLLLATVSAWAATPASGTLTDTVPASHKLTYKTIQFTASNPTPVPQVDKGPRCNANANPCDSYVLTTTFPAGFAALYPGGTIKVTASWTDTGSGMADYDMHVYKGTQTTESGATAANYPAASSANPEVASIFPLVDGNMTYTIFIVPYTATGETVNVSIELVTGAAAAGGGTTSGGGSGSVSTVAFGGPTPTSPGSPRYQLFVPPKGTSAEAGSGEFNIGFNPKTKRIMTMNTGPIWRITPNEVKTAGAPESCEGTWEDKSSTVTDTGLDPILWTDQKSGRTFASNSTAGANGLYAYTDNDGDMWTPLGASPPAGADHQTIATGPYPAALSALGVAAVNQGQYVLYCTQTLVGANCQRSDDLGSSFGPAIPATGPGASNSQGCGGLHGHTHIAKDGTAYLPDKSCGSNQGGAVTTDAGTAPWSEFVVKKTVADANGPAFTTTPQTNGADPSIGIDDANTLYYCYINNEANGTEGHAHVAIGKRTTGTTITWLRDTDVGKAVGVVNGAHTEAVGGSAGRAACGFFGTNVPGNYQAVDFAGNWYMFIATTYDEGKTWSTVNATPNDPVQHASGIWQQGGSSADRNTLDFNEVTIDDRGRVLYGYSDGCVGVGCIAGTSPNDFVAHMRVARQIGGKSLFASNDNLTDTTAPLAPKAACLAGTRIPASSTLTWKVPDSGGNDIQKYEIYRSDVAGVPGSKIGETADAKPFYLDTTSGTTTPNWYYTVKAVNQQATVGTISNQVTLPIGVAPVAENLCSLPGITQITDASGDNTGGVPGTDLRSAQLAQPYVAGGVNKLAFTINTSNGQAAIEPGTFWYVSMRIINGTTTRYAAVRLLGGTTGAPVFEYYVPAAGNGGTVDGRFVTAGSNKAADAASSYASPYNKIVIVIKPSDIGLAVGDTINGFVSGYVQPAGAAGNNVAAALLDQMPNDLGYASSYVVKDPAAFCRPNIAPIIDLFSVAPTSGTTPLEVSFTAAASDPDTDLPADTIAMWHLDFGDGTKLDSATAPNGLKHVYTNTSSTANATYVAKLTVTDSRGLDSNNTKVQPITVQPKAGGGSTPTTIGVIGAATPGKTSTATGRFGGGALGLLTVLPLLVAARRRKRLH